VTFFFAEIGKRDLIPQNVPAIPQILLLRRFSDRGVGIPYMHPWPSPRDFALRRISLQQGVAGSALTRGARTHAALAPLSLSLSLSLSAPVWTAVGWTWTLLPNKARARALSLSPK